MEGEINTWKMNDTYKLTERQNSFCRPMCLQDEESMVWLQKHAEYLKVYGIKNLADMLSPTIDFEVL